MANKTLFKPRRPVPAYGGSAAMAVNAAGGLAYDREPKQALAQYAATGMLGQTYYASADVQLNTVLDLARAVEPEFLARVAIYSRQQAFLKDTPALLTALLLTRDT